jgi:ribosomal protein L14
VDVEVDVDVDGQTVGLGLKAHPRPRTRKRDYVRQVLTKARARPVVRYSGKVIKFAGRAGLVICEIVKETGVVIWVVLAVVAEGM